MPSLLHESIDFILKALLVLMCSVLAVMSVIFIMFMYEETMRSRYLDRLQRETKVPEQLVTTGEHPLASIFLGSEDRICVLHPYVGTRGLDDMTAGQLTAIRGLELPGEEGMWYLVAFERDEIRRVLLITSGQVRLSTDSRCFFRRQQGTIRVAADPTEKLLFLQADFLVEDDQ